MTTWAEAVGLVAAGIGAGVCGSVAGLASLSSYPALLATGMSPVAANVTNTVALVGSSLGSVIGSRPELRGQGHRLRSYAGLTLLGGVIGAVLLLTTPSGGFAKAVPFLIALSAVLVLVQPRLQAALTRRRASAAAPVRIGWAWRSALVGIGLYGGYFGAGAGVMMIAVLALITGDALVRVNALKNVLLGVANGGAAIGFALVGPVHWLPAVLLGLGCVAGGYVGPALVRVIPPLLLRTLIALAGLYLAVSLFLDAY
ncbi:MAG: sulfite exporter TauE/SafE family protein [Nocardioides sp.]|uniref:sulfite exporter TauE/SafE family protein n=1 Tax=Nocardioides sp. TaxID=35761 RepID=UPI0039E6D180